MFDWFKKKQAPSEPPAAPLPIGIMFPWYHQPLLLAGEPNTTKQPPEQLDALAEDGQGIYYPTNAVWGTQLTDVTNRLSIETQSGGVVFFDGYNATPARLEALLQLLDVRPHQRYQVHSHTSDDPIRHGYWTQWRFVSAFALEFYYRYDKASVAALPVAATPLIPGIVQTIEHEAAALSTVDFDAFIGQRYQQQYEGSIGYGFGFLVENHYHGIYRLWSRMLFYSK
jgi:hypothetical protein